MAEVRKHHPDDDDGLGKLVRDALGEKIRPQQPGRSPHPDDEQPGNQVTPDEPNAASLPSWQSDGPTFGF